VSEKPLNKYQQKVVDRILERRKQGLGIDFRSIQQDKDSLISQAKHHFGHGGYKEALAAAGFDWQEIRKEASDVRKRQRHEKWRTEIIQEIQAMHARGEPLRSTDVRKGGETLRLYKRAQTVFEQGWKEAVGAALAEVGKKGEDAGVRGRINWTPEKISIEINKLDAQGTNLSYGNMLADPERRKLFKAGINLHGSWNEAVKATGIDYDEHVRKWMASHRRGGEQELTREALLDLIEERWRSGAPLNPSHKALSSALSASTRLFPPRAGTWKRAVEIASAERNLGIDYQTHVLKNIPNKWNKESIVAEILRLHETKKPLHQNAVFKNYSKLWSAANYYYRNEGGWAGAVNDAGLDYEQLAELGRNQVAEQRKSPFNDPRKLALALLDKEAEVGSRLRYSHIAGKGLENWVMKHGGIKKMRDLMEQERNALGENERLALAARAGDKRAAEQLLNANKPFILLIVNQHGKRLHYDDALQLASLGLLQAIPRFRILKGNKFISYAGSYMRNAMQREPGGTYSGSDTIRIPVYAGVKESQVGQAEAKAAKRGGQLSREAAEQISRFETVENVRKVRRVMSLDFPIPGREKSTFADFIKGTDGTEPEKTVDAKKVRAALEELKEEDPRLAEIVQRSFGLEDDEESCRQIAQSLKLSYECVRQLRQTALKKLGEKLR